MQTQLQTQSDLVALEQFPKSVKRFSDKNCGEKQTVETRISDSIESHFALLRFYQWAGVDVACQEEAVDRFAKIDTPQPSSPPAPSPSPFLSPAAPSPSPIAAAAAIEQARIQSARATTLEELRQNLHLYEGCALKQTAKNTCFADGTPGSALMLVGEAPGRDEDIQGLPFVGRSGQLLNNILKAISLTRDEVYIANVIPWRPPGNRTPTVIEIELCRPFILRQIELAQPKLLVALGGPAAKFLTGETQGILKLRGRWLNHKTASGRDIPVMPTLHPAYLLRTPTHKKLVWQDFLHVKQRMRAIEDRL